MTRPDGPGLSTVASDGWVAPGLAQPNQGSANRIHPNVTPRLTLPVATINPKDHSGLPAPRAGAGLQILGGSEMRQN